MEYYNAKSALTYLRKLESNDSGMFWRHTVDKNGRLQNLFWCDGISRIDYRVFNDVLAFDVRYAPKIYFFSLVVLSGVNHHNQTLIFANAIIADKTEETYLWLLEQFSEAMEGIEPTSVITDGSTALKNAIRIVFPDARHRLCSWHLSRLATTKIGNPMFTKEFMECMLGDYEVDDYDEVDDFQQNWCEVVTKFGIRNHSWIKEIYNKRKKWAMSYVRRTCFYVGFRTTSRCDSLYAQFRKFAPFRYNLLKCLQHFQQGLEHMRRKELEADFNSVYGEPVLVTNFHALERFAARTFTREVFELFLPMLESGSKMKIRGCIPIENYSSSMYMVHEYGKPDREWLVGFYPSSSAIFCSCKWMESFGIPCDHIVAVLVHLGFDELPRGLVLDRWTKRARESILGINDEGTEHSEELVQGSDDEGTKHTEESVQGSDDEGSNRAEESVDDEGMRYAELFDMCKEMCKLACRSDVLFNGTMNMLRHEIEILGAKNRGATSEDHNKNRFFGGGIFGEGYNKIQFFADVFGDPVQGKGKVCAVSTKAKRIQRRGVCHNQESCIVHQKNIYKNKSIYRMASSFFEISVSSSEDDEDEHSEF